MIISPASITRLAGRRVLMAGTARYCTASLVTAPPTVTRTVLIQKHPLVNQQRRTMVNTTTPLFRSAQPIDFDDDHKPTIVNEGVLDDDDLVFRSEAESLHENSKWSVVQIRNLTTDKMDVQVTILNAAAYNWLQEQLKPFRNDPLDLEANFKGYLSEIPKREKSVAIVPYVSNVFASEEYTTIKLPKDPKGNPPTSDKKSFVFAREIGQQDYSPRFLLAGIPLMGGHKYRLEGDSTKVFDFNFPDGGGVPAMDKFDYPPLNT